MSLLTHERLVFLALLLLGFVAVAAFHSSGAIDERDALLAATLDRGVAGSPALSLTARVLSLGVDLVRLVDTRIGLFRAMHLSCGILWALAAALSALVAFRAAPGRPGAGLTAAIFVAAGVLFGSDIARLGLLAGPLPIVLFLLSAAAAAWTRSRPLAFWGGLCLGAATAEHPLVLWTLPGFAALAIAGSLRIPVDEGSRSVQLAFLGWLLGLGVFLLPVLASRGTPLLDYGDPESLQGSLRVWWGSPFWRPVGPGNWGPQFLDHWTALWRNLGPVGLVAGLFGLAAFFWGMAPRVRPFLLMHLFLAIALVFGQFEDQRFATALASWSFLFWMVPTVAAAHARSPRIALALPAIAAVAAAGLLVMNRSAFDFSAERGIAWARDAHTPVPDDSILLTGNPVHVALAAHGERPEVTVIYRGRPSTLRALDPAIDFDPFSQTVQTETLRSIVVDHYDTRPILLDPCIFFDRAARDAILGEEWKGVPFGLDVQIVAHPQKIGDEIGRARGVVWEDFEFERSGLALPLRDDLTPIQYYGRGLLQSASLFLDLGLRTAAEREFLLALSFPEANRTLAAYGLAQILFRGRNLPEAIRTLEHYVRDEEAGAAQALELLGNLYVRTHEDEKAVAAFERCLAAVPESNPDGRAMIERRLNNLQILQR